MANYFDKRGNIYRIEDTEKLRRKGHVEVFNEAGEEFQLPAELADEYKLTLDEKTVAVKEIRERILELLKAAGSVGCPNIDPPDTAAIAGTHVEHQVPGGANFPCYWPPRCLAFDPAPMETIYGTRINPQAQTALNLAKILGGCPNIDPPDMTSIAGTRVYPQAQLQTVLNLARSLGGGCLPVDPPMMGVIQGTPIYPSQLYPTQGYHGLARPMVAW